MKTSAFLLPAEGCPHILKLLLIPLHPLFLNPSNILLAMPDIILALLEKLLHLLGQGRFRGQDPIPDCLDWSYAVSRPLAGFSSLFDETIARLPNKYGTVIVSRLYSLRLVGWPVVKT